MKHEMILASEAGGSMFIEQEISASLIAETAAHSP